MHDLPRLHVYMHVPLMHVYIHIHVYMYMHMCHVFIVWFMSYACINFKVYLKFERDSMAY